MEIRAVAPPAAAPSAPKVQPARLPGHASATETPAAQPPAEAATDTEVAAPPIADGPKVVKMRAELRFDEFVNRVVGRIVDEETGEEIREIPPKELIELYHKTREMLGPIVDETA